jgi:hypothetical protein
MSMILLKEGRNQEREERREKSLERVTGYNNDSGLRGWSSSG